MRAPQPGGCATSLSNGARAGRFKWFLDSLAPLGGRQFRYQFAAQSTSVIGSTLSPVALSLGVLASGLTAADLGLILAAYTAPMMLLVLAGGVTADRWPRHHVMVVSNLIRAVTQSAVGLLLISGNPHLGALIGLQIITGTATAFYAPASTGLTATTVDKSLLQRANALLSLVQSAGGTLGPVAASVLVLTAGAGWALVIDGITFGVAAALLVRVRIPPRVGAKPPQSFRSSLFDGFHEVRKRTWVWSSICAYATSHLALASLYVLGPVLLVTEHNGELAWATIVAAISVGQLLGNVLSLRIEPKRPIFFARLLELAQIPLLVAVAVYSDFTVLVAAAVACGIGMTFPDTLWHSTLQRNVPEDSISRISSYDWMGSLVLRPVGYAGAAAVSATIGLAPTLLSAAVLIFLTRIATAALPGVRALRNVPSEVVDVAVEGRDAQAEPTGR